MKRISEKVLAIIMAICIIGAVLMPISAAMTSLAAGDSDPAYEFNFSKCTSADSNVRFAGLNKPSGTLTVSFDYYVPCGAKTYVKSSDDLGQLNNGVRGTFSQTIKCDGTNVMLYICQDATANPGKVYLWNLSVVLNDAAQKLSFKGQYSATYKTITVGDLPEAPIALDMQDRNTKVFKITGTTVNSFFANRFLDISSGSHTYGISFDYYLANGKASVRDLENNKDVADAALNTAVLADGVHRFNGSISADAYSVRLGIQQTSSAKLELYIANLVVTRDGEDVTRKDDYIMTNFSRETVTVGDIEFPGTVYALKISASKNDATAVLLYNRDTALGADEKIEISFNYLVPEAADKANFVNEPGAKAKVLSPFETATAKVMEYHKTLTKADLGDTVNLAAQIEAGAKGDLYVWNLRIKDGKGNWLDYPTVQEAVQNADSEKVIAVVYDDIPIPTPIYHFQANEAYTSLSYEKANTAAGKYRVTFEYYMVNDNVVEVGESLSWTPVNDSETGRSALLPGHHFFDGTVEIDKDRTLAFAIMSRDNLDTDVFVKNFRIYYEGKWVEDTGELQIYHPTPKDEYVNEHFSYPPKAERFPEEKQEEDDPGTTDPTKPDDEKEIPVKNQLMLKQMHGKSRDGKPLAFAVFAQWVGLAESGHEVKAGDRYRLTFDYYVEPAEGDLIAEKPADGKKTQLMAVLRWPADGKMSTAYNSEGNFVLNDNNEPDDLHLLITKGRHSFSREFEIPQPNIIGKDKQKIECKEFLFGLQTMGDGAGEGSVYYWNFKLIDLQTGKNVLTKGIFEAPADTAWSRYTSGMGGALGGMNGRWGVQEDSADGKGAYCFVPYDTKKATSDIGKNEDTKKQVEDEVFDDDDEDINLDQETAFDDEDVPSDDNGSVIIGEGDDADIGEDVDDNGDVEDPDNGSVQDITDDDPDHEFIEPSVEQNGVDVINTTLYRTRRRTLAYENEMDLFWFIFAIVEAVLLVGCIVTGTILFYKRRKNKLNS